MNMNRVFLIAGLAMAVCWGGCSKNDEGSHIEKNWYTLTLDENATPLEREIYAIYEETGIPIFLSDTLGAQTRYDLGGNEYTYYKVFDPGYTFVQYSSQYTYSLETDEADLEAMVDLLGNYALRPYFRNDYGEGFKGKYGPHALVVLDSISKGSYKYPDTLLMDLGVIGLSTRYTMKIGKSATAVSSYIGVQELTEEQKQDFGWNFAMYELNRFFTNAYPSELLAYQEYVTTIPQEPIYDEDGDQTNTRVFELGSMYNRLDYGLDWNEPRKYGILYWGGSNLAPDHQYANYSFPKELIDLHQFMEMIYTKSDEEIRAENAAYPHVIARYEMLLALLNKCGLTQFIYGNHE